MNKILLLLIFIWALPLQAQERFIDAIFELEKPITETYASKQGENLHLDIYQPAKDTLQGRPVIIFMHGGGFSCGSRRHQDLVKFAETAAKKGYVAVLISYRLTRKGQSFGCDYEASGKMHTFKLAGEDFLDAVNFMIQNKEEYRIDPEKVIAGGSSAGAEAVLNAVYNQRLLFEDLSNYENFSFAGVFSLAVAMVDAKYITQENALPGVFFHGTQDNLVPYNTGAHHRCDRDKPGYILLDGSKTITERLDQLNSSYLLYSFEGGKHEHSAMPFDYFPEVFSFFHAAILNGEKQQIEVLK